MNEVVGETQIPYKKKLKVMSVDDNLENQKLMTALAQINKWDMCAAYDGQEAVQKFESDKFDIVFMDIQMPKMDGYDATRWIRYKERQENREKTPVIAITAYTMQEDRQNCFAAGMDDFLSKPLNFDDLYAAIERLIHKDHVDKKDLSGSPPADISKLIKIFGEDRKLIKELIDILINTYPKELEKLRKALAYNDCTSIERTAHSFKGSIGNFGAVRTYELLQRLECMGREKRLEGAQYVLDELFKEMETVQEFLLEYKL